MNKKIIMLGGFLAFWAVLLSFFIPELAWYNINAGTETQWFNAMGGANEVQIPDPIVFLTFLPGNLVVLGAVVAMVGGKKIPALVGFFLMAGGIVLFILNVSGITGVELGSYNWVLFNEMIQENGENVLWGSFENAGWTFHIGYGLIATTGSALITLVGAFLGED